MITQKIKCKYSAAVNHQAFPTATELNAMLTYEVSAVIGLTGVHTELSPVTFLHIQMLCSLSIR